MVTVELFGIDEIREMMGTTKPIDGCMIVARGPKRGQIAFTNERPPEEWQWFEYETDKRRDCLPIFTSDAPVYGVIVTNELWVSGYDALPIAKLSDWRYVYWGIAVIKSDGEERRLYLNIDDRAYTVLKRDSIMKVGDRLLVHFPYNPEKVATAKALGGRFFPYLKSWVFPAEMGEGLDNLVPCGVIPKKTPRRSSPVKRRLGENEKTVEREYNARFDCPLCGAEVEVTGKALMPAHIKREVNARCTGCGAWSRWRTTATEEDWFLDPPIFAKSNLPITPEGGKFVELAHSMIEYEMLKDMERYGDEVLHPDR
jgi:hypothetical protein